MVAIRFWIEAADLAIKLRDVEKLGEIVGACEKTNAKMARRIERMASKAGFVASE